MDNTGTNSSKHEFHTYEGHPGKTRFATRVIHFLSRRLIRLFFKTKIEGIENIPQSGTSCLVLAKHIRNEDIPLGLGTLLEKRKDVWCIMKSELANPKFRGFFLHCGGIAIDRKRPEKSKQQLLTAREILYDNQLVTIFPEQTFFPKKMGQGKVPGFRFVAGKPKEPIYVLPIGFRYTKGRWYKRPAVIIKVGPASMYSKHDDPAVFLHDRMVEIAELSGLEYKYERPESRKKK